MKPSLHRVTLAVIGLVIFNISTTVSRSEVYTYTINNDTITITGYTGPGGAITIPGTINGLPVTSIGEFAFYNCTSLTSVTIPDRVTTIGGEAFKNCTSLTNVTIGNSVTFIRAGAFAACTSLTSVTIPASVITIEDGYWVGWSLEVIGAFSACTSLANVSIGNGVTDIGDLAFQNCTSLTNVTIGNSVTTIGWEAFASCTSLTSVTVPDSVTNIWYFAFQNCTNLTSVYFQGNALHVSVETNAFASTPATVYYLPGTTSWGPWFGGRPTAPWHLPKPVILDFAPTLGVQSSHLGFRVSWATNAYVVIEASTNLTSPTWSPIATNTIRMVSDPLTDGWSDFTDPNPTTHSARFYRIRSQ